MYKFNFFFQIPSKDISDYVKSYCDKIGVDQDVSETTSEIIELAKETWLSQVGEIKIISK